MTIELSELSYDELLDLNAQIIERLKFLDTVDACEAMMRFNLGSRVCFDSGRHGLQTGSLIKFNQKTVAVQTDDGRRWKVSAQMLSPVMKEDKKAGQPTHVIDLKKKDFKSD